MESLRQDIRFALRSFVRQPALTLIAVVSLGLGIGATATVFTWLQGFVLNPFPAVRAWDRVVVAHTRAPGGGSWEVSWPDFQDWRAGARSADLAAWDMMQLGLRDGSGPTERAWGMPVSGNYFEALQVGATLGRVLRMEDERSACPSPSWATASGGGDSPATPVWSAEHHAQRLGLHDRGGRGAALRRHLRSGWTSICTCR